MTKRFATYLCYLLSVGLLTGACNRPIAYYQRGPVVHYSTSRLTSTAVAGTEPIKQAPNVAERNPPVVASSTLAHQSTNPVEELTVYVQNDTKLVSDKQLNNRMSRLKNLLDESSAKGNVSPATTQHKTTVLERLMIKKLNKKISKHLSPDKSKKTMINGGLLSGSLILLIGGILLLALASGTGAVIGLIAAIVGALGVVFGLLAS